MLLFFSVREYIGSKMSKLPGPSRIPTFGTRIPQLGSTSKNKQDSKLPKPKQEDHLPLTPADVGKLVETAGKIGILRFVGKVHFARGVWCGIELQTDGGKSDGSIDGIRYFTCSRDRGLMTPLSKVSIPNESRKHEIAKSRSSDSVRSIDERIQTYESKQDSSQTIESKNDVILEVEQFHEDIYDIQQDRTPPGLPLVENGLKTKRATDEIEREKHISPKNAYCGSVYDKNDNKKANRELSLNYNNNTTKRNSILTHSEERYFHSPLERNIPASKFVSTPVATTSTNNNGNSLLLVETITKTGYTKIETCEELFEKSLTSQMNVGTQNRNDTFMKIDEPTELLHADCATKESSQILESKDKLKRELTFNRHTPRSKDNKEQSSENPNIRTFIFNSQEDENKRDSLDLDESLEILTVSQMNDGFSVVEPFFALDDINIQKKVCQSPTQTPNFDLIVKENVTLISDTTMNLELTLDTADKSKNFGFDRLDETPSPEELPLDPIPIVEEEPKSEATKSKTNSFITSITSITSLDTGYQGDGEMSRPGSRGADNSPLTRRPLQRTPARRADAMTDSDFFTESDADNHDENVLRGDRRAQVIDGTLYGVDPQAAADIYVNNRENMDSSGIFTDIESNTRTEELLIDEKIDISPTDTSSKTLSENSQTNLQEVIAKNEANKSKENPSGSKKRGSPSPVISNISNNASPRHLQRDDSVKKYKTLKKEVQSKVKILLETNTTKPEKKTLKKPAGRWDAVMNKISKTDSKTNFQEVKSRVFNNVNSSPNSLSDTKKQGGVRQVNNLKSPNNKLRRVRTRVLSSPNPSKNSNGGSIHSSLSDLSASLPKKTIGSIKKREVQQVTQVLTAAKLSPKQTSLTADGKRRSPAPTSDTKAPRKSIFSSKDKKQISNKEKKLNPLRSSENLSEYENKDKELIKIANELLNVDQLIQTFENGRSTVKGGRTSPVIRSPTLTRAASKPVPKTTEALAVLVQHLVFNVEAFQVPYLRRQVKKFQLEAEDIRLAYQRLEEQLSEEKQKNTVCVEEVRSRWREDVAHLIENHRTQISQLTNQKKESEEKLQEEHEASKAELRKQYEEKLCTFKRELEKLQRTHEESLDILREENEAIREDIDIKNEEIRNVKQESLKLKKEYEAKESRLKEQIQVLTRDNQKFKQDLAICKEEISKLEEERTRLLEENKRLLSYGEGKGVGVQEVESLRVVLELKQNEVSDLRKSLAEATQKAELLSGCEEKAALMQARCEDLQLQLERKNDYEMMLLSENKKMEQSLHEETNQRRSLSLRNEELQWKLKQNKEVITKILEQTSDDVFNKSAHLSSSFNNDRYSSNTSLNISFKNFSPSNKSSVISESKKKLKKTKSSVDEDESPPSSPKIKGVVEKSDSVSYVLDLDESPDVVASRLVRRSFRNSLNQKNTPTKSPCTKRPRMKGNPLSQSSSASSLISSNKVEYNRFRSVSVRNCDDDFQDDFNFSDNSSSPSPYHYSNLKLDESCERQKNDERDLDYLDDHVLDLTLPALPSELGCKKGVQALPRPKHLAGEAMVSESNSDDESTSSSSGQL